VSRPQQAELNLGRTLRDLGAASVTRNTPALWCAKADLAIAVLAASGRVFTAEDVRRAVGDPPHHPNAMGARFLAACTRGVLVRVGTALSPRALRRAGTVAQWRGAP
jgi:hypothetical protein